MMRAWIGLALLSASWLLGLGFFTPPHWTAWMAAVALGAVLLASRPVRLPGGREAGIAAAMLLPAVWFMPWPYRAAPLLIAAGLVLQLLPVPLLGAGLPTSPTPAGSGDPRTAWWPKRLGWGAVKAGVVLLGQSLAVLAYAKQTARSHDLPWPLPLVLGRGLSLLGIDAAADGGTLAVHSMREIGDVAAIHSLGATWELLLDPATLSFFVGGLILLGMTTWGDSPARSAQVSRPRRGVRGQETRAQHEANGSAWPAWVRSARVFAILVAAWLPVRAGLLVALYLERVARANPAAPLTAMNQFFSPTVAFLFLLGPVFLAWRFVRGHAGQHVGEALPLMSERDQGAGGRGQDVKASVRAQVLNPEPRTLNPDHGTPGLSQRLTYFCTAHWRYPAALALVALAVAIFSFTVEWDPVGSRKAGRVMFVERHSTWEPTDRPYDKDNFGHDPSYSYTRAYDYCSQFYRTSRLQESDAISPEKLSECDVLVVKIPTARFSGDEVRAITRFVEAGGGLLLIGDHTNVFDSSTYLNDLSRPFGFTFRHDLLFAIGSPYNQELRRPLVPHPVVQHLPPMVYAVSCSIDPGTSRGRGVVTSTGLWNLPPEYHSDNYHPHAKYRPEMRYGAFIQLWGVRHGSGRVLAFTDSTIFSNFCIFQDGKVELLVGMLEWLNHTSALDRGPVRFLAGAVAFLAALVALAAGLTLGRTSGAAWLTLVAAGVLGWTTASMAVAAVHRRAMPEPPVLDKPMTCVAIDRTVSEAPLSLGAYTQGDGRGYGLFEQWISRLGYRTKRSSGREAFSGDALVILCPTRSVSEEFREGLVEYVAGGGRVLVVDSPDVAGSTANSLLWPFGMASDHSASRSGKLALEGGWPGIEVEACCRVTGGEPLLWVDETPVAARVAHGKGSVMALGVGSVFGDANMGREWMPDPDAELLTRFDLLFALVEALVEDRPVAIPPPRPAASAEGSQP